MTEAYKFGRAIKAMATVIAADQVSQNHDSSEMIVSSRIAQLQYGDPHKRLTEIFSFYQRAKGFLSHNEPDEAQDLVAQVDEAMATVNPKWIESIGTDLTPEDLLQIHLGYMCSK